MSKLILELYYLVQDKKEKQMISIECPFEACSEEVKKQFEEDIIKLYKSYVPNMFMYGYYFKYTVPNKIIKT